MPRIENVFLAGLSAAQIAGLQLEPCALRRHDYVYRLDDEVTYLYFMERTAISLIRPLSDGTNAPAWTFDGTMIGAQIRFWVPASVFDMYVRIGGSGWRVPRDRFLGRMLSDPDLLRRTLAWILYFDHAVVKSQACQWAHSVDQRFCRMLLALQITMKGDTRIELSLPEIATMLGTTSSYLYRLAKTLDAAVRVRGNYIELLDTSILAAGTCACFEAINQRRERAMCDA